MRWWDVPAVMELERVLFPDEPWTAEGFWAELALGRDRVYLVAEAGGEGIVGYAGLSCPAHARGNDAEVMTVAVAPAAQGRGVGSALRGGAPVGGAGARRRTAAAGGAGRQRTRAGPLRGPGLRRGRPPRRRTTGARPATAARHRVDALVLALRLAPAADSVSP